MSIRRLRATSAICHAVRDLVHPRMIDAEQALDQA
jgi:hypothetical protein